MYNRQNIIRFCIVGVLNTVIDISIFLFLRTLSFGIVTANLFSTSVALLVSFKLNRSFTFQNNSEKQRRQFIRFLIVTVFGLWVLQPVVIKVLLDLNAHLNYIRLFPDIMGRELISADLVSKMVSTVVSLTWNYIWYNKYVFIDKNKSDSN